LPVALYESETWSLKLKKKCRLRGFEIRVLRRIFGPERLRDKGEGGRPHNMEVNDL